MIIVLLVACLAAEPKCEIVQEFPTEDACVAGVQKLLSSGPPTPGAVYNCVPAHSIPEDEDDDAPKRRL